jgi:hypothetical protein
MSAKQYGVTFLMIEIFIATVGRTSNPQMFVAFFKSSISKKKQGSSVLGNAKNVGTVY